MSQWEMVRLGDVCQFINGDRGKNYPTTSDFIQEGVPFINAGHLNNKKVDFTNMNYISEEKYTILGSGKVRKHDILYCLRGSLGKLAILDSNIKGAIASSLVILRTNPEIEVHYLSYWFESPQSKSQQEKNLTGSSQPNLSASNVKQYQIPLPPLEKQQEIAHELDEITEIIALRKEQIKKLDLLVKAKFVEMFGDKEFPIEEAKSVCNLITKGTTPESDNLFSKPFVDSIPFLKVYNLSYEGKLFFEEKPQYISKNTHEDLLKRSIVKKNDVLMNIVGPPLGKFALVTDEFPQYNINQAIAVFRCKTNVSPIYFLHRLKDEGTLSPIIKDARGVRQQNISLAQCNSLKIPLPPLPLQEQFAHYVQAVEKTKQDMEEGLAKMEMLYQQRMQKWFG